MTSKLVFTGVKITAIDAYIQDGTLVTRLHCAANYTKTIRERFGLPELDGLRGGDIESEALLAASVLVTAASEKSAARDMDISISDVTKLKFARIKEKDGEASRLEIRFILTSADQTAPAKAGVYMRSIGEEKSRATVTLAQDTLFSDHDPKEDEEEAK